MNPQISRWFNLIHEFDITIKHRPGADDETQGNAARDNNSQKKPNPSIPTQDVLLETLLILLFLGDQKNLDDRI